MVAHACLAACFLEFALILLVSYVVNGIMKPANMTEFDIAGNMLFTIAALTISAYDALMSVHYFLLWHNSQKY